MRWPSRSRISARRPARGDALDAAAGPRRTINRPRAPCDGSSTTRPRDRSESSRGRRDQRLCGLLSERDHARGLKARDERSRCAIAGGLRYRGSHALRSRGRRVVSLVCLDALSVDPAREPRVRARQRRARLDPGTRNQGLVTLALPHADRFGRAADLRFGFCKAPPDPVCIDTCRWDDPNIRTCTGAAAASVRGT